LVRPTILEHDPGLAASPPVRYTVEVATSEVSLPALTRHDHERARAHGAKVLQEPTEHPYGERECTIEDLARHRWQFTQTVRDVVPEEWGGVTVNPRSARKR
jgi:uncharacterized glyoxalase superfamily protein PhnB